LLYNYIIYHIIDLLLNFLFLYTIYLSIYSPFFLSLLFLYAVCGRQLFGCLAKSNSLSYGSSSAVSYDCGCSTASIFSSWICGKDCDISEVSWSDSLRFIPFFLFLSCEGLLRLSCNNLFWNIYFHLSVNKQEIFCFETYQYKWNYFSWFIMFHGMIHFSQHNDNIHIPYN